MIYYVITNLDSELIIQLVYVSHFWQIKFEKALTNVYKLEWNSAQLIMKSFYKKLKVIGFSEGCITSFQSCISERIFFISVENQFPDYGRISCGVPQASILWLFHFFIYVNDIPQALNSNLLLYADHSCLMFKHKDVEEIEEILNK